MKPVIITLNSDNKVVMSVEEFKRHMDAAYNQGYSDGNSAATTLAATPYNKKWWYDVTCNGQALNTATYVDGKVATDSFCLSDKVTADTCDCVAGYCNCNTECSSQVTIKDYLKNKGE